MMEFFSKRSSGKGASKSSPNAEGMHAAASLPSAGHRHMTSFIVAYAQLLQQADQSRRAGKMDEAYVTFKRVFKSAIEQKEEAAMQEAAWGVIQTSSSPKRLAQGGMAEIFKTATKAADITVSGHFKDLMTRIVKERETGLNSALKERAETLEKNQRFEKSFRTGAR